MSAKGTKPKRREEPAAVSSIVFTTNQHRRTGAAPNLTKCNFLCENSLRRVGEGCVQPAKAAKNRPGRADLGMVRRIVVVFQGYDREIKPADAAPHLPFAARNLPEPARNLPLPAKSLPDACQNLPGTCPAPATILPFAAKTGEGAPRRLRPARNRRHRPD
jgi:hypothetical protein